MEDLQKTVIMTHSGQVIHFLDPSATIINWSDIDYVLPRLRRYNAHQDTMLLDHLVLCTLLVYMAGGSDLEAGYAAIHDLHEVWFGDLPGGLKECIPDLYVIEEMWEGHVHNHFGYAFPPHDDIAALVKKVDLRARDIECLYHGFNTLFFEDVLKIAPLTKLEQHLAAMVFTSSTTDKLNLIHTAIAHR